MPMPMQWLSSCRLQSSTAAPRPIQQQQNHRAPHSTPYTCSSTGSNGAASSTARHTPAASAGVNISHGPCSSTTSHARAVAASAAAAGAFPLPEPSSFHNSSSSRVDAACSAAPAAAHPAAAANGLSSLPPPGWQISSHIRHTVEEAMSGMGFVHLPHHQPAPQAFLQQQQDQQQQQGEGECVGQRQQQQQHEGLQQQVKEQQQQQQQQQQHASWQQLVYAMGQVEAQHSSAAATAAPVSLHAAAAAAAPSAAAESSHIPGSINTRSSSSSSSSNSSRVLLAKSTQQIQACKSAADLEQLLQGNWQQMDHIHISSTFVQLARISQQQQQQQQQQQRQRVDGASLSPHGLSEGGWALLQQAAQQQLHRMHSRHCSSLLWACATLGTNPCEPLLQGLLARSQTLLHQGTTPQGFANTLWALARLRVQPGGAWLAAFFTASQQQLCNFQPQELSSTIWALAQLRVAPPGEWSAAFFAASAAKLGACSGQSLGNQLWGVARLGLAVPEYWWAAVTYACGVKAAELSPAGVCQVLWGAGMIAGKQQRRQQRGGSAGVLRRRREEQEWGYVAAAAPAANSTSSSSSSSSGSTQWLVPLLAAVEQQLGQLTSTAAATLLWAVVVLGHKPGQGFVSSCLGCISGGGSLSASDAVHALWAASSLGGAAEGGVGVQEVMPLLLQAQQLGLHSCKPHEFVYAAAALANLSKGPQQQQQQGLLPPLPEVNAAAGPVQPASCADSVTHLAQQLLNASQPQLQQFQLGQLVQLGRWLAAAGLAPSEAWVGSFLAATAPHLHILQPGQQLLLLHAVRHWGVQEHQGWAALFLSSSTSDLTLRSYSAGHVGALLQALAAAHLQPQRHHVQPLLQRVLQADAGLDAAGLAAVLGGLFSLGFRPPDGWVQQLWAAGAAAVLRSDPAGLTAVATVLQHRGIWQLSLRPNRPFAAALHAAAAAALPLLQPQQASAVLAGLTAARMKPKGAQEHLLPGLMAVAVKGLYSMSLQDVVATWWSLVLQKVLSTALPVEQLDPAAAAAAGQPGQQQGQDQQWLQQQWQGLWLRRICSSSSTGQLAALPAASLLQLADCLRRLQQPVPGSWADAYIIAASAHLPKMAPHELHLLMHALPCLDGAAGGTLSQFTDRLLAAAAPLLQDFSPSQLSDSLYSIQQAGFKPPEPWIKSYISAASVKLPQFWPRQLTRVLTALARLRFMPDAKFLSAATEAAVEHLPKYRVDPGEMVDLLWAIVALRVRPSAAWMAKFEARLLERGPEQLDGQQLSRLGWCMSALQRKPGRVLWAKWLAATQEQMPSMDSSSLADTLWTCAMLDEQPSPAWLSTFSSSSQQHLHSFGSSTLVNVVWSLALLQHRPPSDWTLSCMAALSRSFAATAAAVSADDQDHQQQLLLAAQAQQQDLEVEPLSPAQLVRVSWSLAALDCQLPAALSAQLLQLCMQHASHLDADSLAQLVWAWDRLDTTQDKQLVRQIAAAVRSQLMPHAYNSLMGGVLQGGYSSSSAGSRSSSRAEHSGADTVLQRPVAKVRVGQQQRIVVRSNGSGPGRAVVVAAQQQAAWGGQEGGAVLAAVPAGAAGFVPQRGVFGSGGKGKLGTKQQLMATLQKIYAAEVKSLSSGSSGAADAAELSVV